MNTANPTLSRLAKTLVAGFAVVLVGPLSGPDGDAEEPEVARAGLRGRARPDGPGHAQDRLSGRG